MSARLTNSIREGIIENEVKKKFYDKITKAESDLKMSIDAAIAKTVPKWITEEIETSGYINVQSAFKAERGDLNREAHDQIRWAEIDNYYPCTGYHHKLVVSKSMENKAEKLAKLNTEQNEFRRKLQTIVYSFTTAKLLLENVPEFKDYFKDAENKSKNALVPTEEIKAVRKELVK